MFCPKCGSEISKGSDYCAKCGHKLRNPIVKVSKIEKKDNKNNNGNDNVLIIAIIIGLIILIGIIGFAFLSGTFNSNNSNGKIGDSGVNFLSYNNFPISEAPGLANQIVSSGYSFPIQYKSLSLTKSQCLYILTKAITEISIGNEDGTINVLSPKYASNPRGADYSQTITDSQYIAMSNRFSSWIERNGAVPNYVGINAPGVPDISPNKMLKISADVLIQYGNTGILPTVINV